MFVDKYRPTKVSEMILTSEVKKLITGIKKKKTVPNMIFHGGAGTGKTTLARALCNDMNIEVLELNASLDNSIDNVSHIKELTIPTGYNIRIILFPEF